MESGVEKLSERFKMSKLVFIVDMIASQACKNPVKIMHIYMNRFAIDENASFEIISVQTLMYQEINLSPSDGPGEFFLKSKVTGEEQEVSQQEFLDDINQGTVENLKPIEHAIESSLHKANEFENELDLNNYDLMNTHLIYSGNAFNWMDVLGHNVENSIGPKEFEEKVKCMVRNALKKYKINSIMLTFLELWKHNLITQATADQFSVGKIKTKNGGIIESVYDDLEKFFKARFLIDW